MDVDAFLPVVLGGALTIVGGYVAVFQEHRLQNKIASAKERKEAYAVAFTGYMKLVEFHGWMSSNQRSINECFGEAYEMGMAEVAPCHKVKEIIGPAQDPATLNSDELRAAMRGGDVQLIGELLQFQNTVLTAFSLLKRYNDRRSRMSELMLKIENAETEVSETEVSLRSDSPPSAEIEINEGMLNQLLGDLMESLEAGIPRCRELLERYRQSAFFDTDGKPPRAIFQE